jgi:hypothetical protein
VIKSIIIRWEKHLARVGERRTAYKILVGRPEGRTPFESVRRRWEDIIKMELQHVGWGTWIVLIWLRIGTGGRLL